ncbi:MAG: hypothetical protein ACKO0N_01410, partial [Planctomycetota bacterium]
MHQIATGNLSIPFTARQAFPVPAASKKEKLLTAGIVGNAFEGLGRPRIFCGDVEAGQHLR